jgi:hypothetical protein
MSDVNAATPLINLWAYILEADKLERRPFSGKVSTKNSCLESKIKF